MKKFIIFAIGCLCISQVFSQNAYLGKKLAISASLDNFRKKSLASINIEMPLGSKWSLDMNLGKCVSWRGDDYVIADGTDMYFSNIGTNITVLYSQRATGTYNFDVKQLGFKINKYAVKHGAIAPYGRYDYFIFKTDYLKLINDDVYLENGNKVTRLRNQPQILQRAYSIGLGTGHTKVYDEIFIFGWALDFRIPLKSTIPKATNLLYSPTQYAEIERQMLNNFGFNCIFTFHLKFGILM